MYTLEEERSRRKVIIIRIEINEIENRKSIAKINKNQMLVFWNVVLEGKPAHIIRTESLTGHRQQTHDSVQFTSVQSLSRVRLFATPWITAHQASLSITISRSSLELTSIESVMPSSHLIPCRPLFFLPPIPPSILVVNGMMVTYGMLWHYHY